MRKRILSLLTRQAYWCLIGLIVLSSVAGGFAAAPQFRKTARKQSSRPPRVPEPIVARVNHEEITYRELAEECIARKGAEVLDMMISRLLVLQACKARGIRVTPQEVDEEIGHNASRLNMSREELMKVIRNKRGISPQRYAEEIVLPGLALKKLATPYVKVTEEDIDRSFEARYGEKVKCRWIMLGDQRIAMREWDELRDSSKSDDGTLELEDFERSVTVYSSDVASRSIGGQINPIGRHNAAPFQELERAAFALKKDGEISKVIQLGEAYVILYREARISPEDKRLEDVRQEMEAQIYKAKMQSEVARIFKELEQNARIENLLTGDVSIPAKKTASRQPAASGKASRPPGTKTKAGAKLKRTILR